MLSRSVAIALLLSALCARSQQTAGTREADDTSREAAASRRIASAESALEKQDYANAAALLSQLATERPKDARVLYDLGFAEERLSKDDDAADAYAKAIAADPTLHEPQISLGLLDARAGRTEKAHLELQKVASTAEASPALRARALRALAQIDTTAAPAAASAELLEAIKLSGEQPGDAELSAQLAEHSGDAASAETAFRSELAAHPDDVEAAIGLARLLKSSGKLADAESELVAGRSASPANALDPRLVAQLVTVYVGQGKDAQAMPLLEQLRAQDPTAAKDPVLAEMLARMYGMNGREADAEALYRQILSQAPNDPALLDGLGGVLVKELKNDEAVAVLKKAVDLRADFHDDRAWAEAASHLAFAASRAHQPELCLQALAERATVLPNSPASLFLSATAHDTLHQKKQAIDEYKAFLAAAAHQFPDEEFEARHRLVALQNER